MTYPGNKPAVRAHRQSKLEVKWVLFLVIGCLLTGCRDNPKAGQQVDPAKEVTVEAKPQANPGEDTHASWMDEITLDQGAKWAANAETTSGVAQMIALIGSTQTDGLEDYHRLGNGLNEIKNYIVKECTMTGPSHDNLHVWLYPLVDKIGRLQKVETVESGKALTHEIKGHLDKYHEFFI